ncbi:hypothetical protein HDA32_001538 [Spinactinospora alkalitolerans]|uniref:Uncharacterized protein n=1 Tax=Spinactinospora alkalitolerans TaxID=687207 RepID=A0A852TR30_9ACTN|nr:hypothetical protein [Spinactinospora alkalitolerans]NYE46418.1 hypothetical protein [Spinactinospora alkalitolerans]
MTAWLVIPIVMCTVLACGVAGLPFSVTALGFMLGVHNAYNSGRYDVAVKRLRWAKGFGWTGLVLGLLNIAAGLTAAVFSAMEDAGR